MAHGFQETGGNYAAKQPLPSGALKEMEWNNAEVLTLTLTLAMTLIITIILTITLTRTHI